MTTPGPTQLPQAPQPVRTDTPAPQEQQNARITTLPIELRNIQEALKLSGEVVNVEKSGQVQIRTESGDIEVKVSPRQAEQLQSGDQVEIDIPPGRPPQTANITKEAPPADQPPDIQEPPRTSETPVDVDVPPEPRPADQPAPSPPRTLQEEQIVRLQPLTPEQAAAYLSETLDDIITTAANSIDSKLQSVVLEVTDDILKQVLNIAPQSADKPVLIVIPPASNPFSRGPELILTNNAASPQTATPQTVSIDVEGSIPVNPFLTPPLPEGAIPLQLEGVFTTPSIPDKGIFFTNSAKDFVFTAPIKAEIVTIQPPGAEIVQGLPQNEKIQTNVETKGLPLILQNQKAVEIPAMIVGTTPQNLPVITLLSPQPGEQLFFILHMPAPNMIPGTQITLQPQDILSSSLPVMTSVSFPMQPAAFLTPEPWPLMDEVYQTLVHIAPQLAHAVTNTTPNPSNPSQIGPAALFFLAAIRGGDLLQWLGGRANDALERSGKQGLLSKLSQEGSTLSRLTSEPVSQDWRAVMLPLFWDDHMHKIALYYKHDGQNNPDNPAQGKQTRFVFDLKLDQMGKVQIDGLFRLPRLDLIVRTQEILSQAMQADMRKTYAHALGQTQITGELSFQNKPEQWVTIKADKRSQDVSA